MENKPLIRIGEKFKPSKKVKIVYYFSLLMAMLPLFFFLAFMLLVIYSLSPQNFLKNFWIFVAIFLISLALEALYVEAYYNSVFYKLTENEIIKEEGVFSRSIKIVPYYRITNIDIFQDPFSRILGLASLYIQTAGTPGVEMKIDGLEENVANYLRYLILQLMRRRYPQTGQQNINMSQYF